MIPPPAELAGRRAWFPWLTAHLPGAAAAAPDCSARMALRQCHPLEKGEIVMMRLVIAVVFILHGLVHLLYFGQSAGLFELQPGMLWPQGSWAFARLLGIAATKGLASAACVAAAAGFAGGGVGLLLRQAWWRLAVVDSAVFSIVLFVLFWDGSLHRLDNQGAIGILINAAILAAVAAYNWPQLGP
jgi:hypothetical protein